MNNNITITQQQIGCNTNSQIIKCYTDKINSIQCDKCYFDGGIMKCVRVKKLINKQITNKDDNGNTQTITFG